MFPRAKKSYGQNFLVDRGVMKKIIAAAELKAGETVLEIGPGTGVLTEALLHAGVSVVAVEADPELTVVLQQKFGSRITLIEGDILVARLSLPDSRFKLIANIPYNITSSILEKFLTEDPRPSRMVLMVQREVADRIVAKPGEMSLLSVVCQLYAECKKIANVPAGAFQPAPKVDSAIIRLDPFTREASLDPERVIALAKAGFSSRRKQLHGNLTHAGLGTSQKIKEILVNLGLRQDIRAEALSVDDWVRLSSLLSMT